MPQWMEAAWDWMNSPIGSGLTVALIVAILTASVRKSRRAVVDFVRWMSTWRLTTTARQQEQIAAAVATATARSQDEKLSDSLLWEMSAQSDVLWTISRAESDKHAYILENRGAGDAEEVLLDAARGAFEFLDDAAWDLIPQGESRRFLGRIARGPLLGLPTRIDITWNDEHGDGQVYRVQL